MKNFFVKSHGLGNDYIVLDSQQLEIDLTPVRASMLCDVHYGIGSDGILLKVPARNAEFGLRIINPDGSEAEKSGNGLRIFSKFLFDYGFVSNKEFSIETPGGTVQAMITEEKNGKATMIRMQMGKAVFDPANIPVLCEQEECLDQPLTINSEGYSINCVSVGNPHCVIIKDNLDKEEILEVGSLIENHSIFPNRINVQFAKVISPKLVEALIWERGAGYTLASGSSSCAVAAVVVKKGLAEPDLTIKMPGGKLNISIDPHWNIQMEGEVQEIVSGTLSPELIEEMCKTNS